MEYYVPLNIIDKWQKSLLVYSKFILCNFDDNIFSWVDRFGNERFGSPQNNDDIIRAIFYDNIFCYEHCHSFFLPLLYTEIFDILTKYLLV